MKTIRKGLAIILATIIILTTFSVATPVFAINEISDEFCEQEEMTSKIVSEVTELREEYAKHFVCEDGSYIAATYSEPVHYKENGQWKEIDNSLELTAETRSGSSKAVYTPVAGTVDVKIPQSFSNGQKVTATNKGYTISFGANHDKIIYKNKPTAVVKEIEELSSNKLTKNSVVAQNTPITTETTSNESVVARFNNNAMTVTNQSGAVVYENVFGNTDLEYIVSTNSIKENIVVSEKQNNYKYSFNMDFGELIPIVNEDNSINVVHPKNTEETIFYIEAPYMYDANEVESTAIEMSLVEDDGIYIMTLQADTSWINSSERVFPVIIDPTIYLSFDDVFVMDGLLNKNTTKINKELRVGRNLTNLTRTYIKPTVPSNIPKGSHINAAYLILPQKSYYQAPSGDDISICVYDCYDVNTWNPTQITWENQPYNNSDNGYKNGHSSISTVLAQSNKAMYTFVITSAARRWLNSGINNGLMLASSNESTKTQVDLQSSRVTNADNYPSVQFQYTAPSLSFSTWETDSQAAQKSFTIEVGSNWTASTDADWISLESVAGSPVYGKSTNSITVSENLSTESRTGTVTIKVGNTVIGTITVTQYGLESYITLDTTLLNFGAGKNKKTLNIESNTAWSFGETPDWITITSSTGSNNSTVEIEVSENPLNVAREYAITITADSATQIVNIYQNYDSVSPATPTIYEEDGLVYIFANTVDFDASEDSSEHIEYKLENGEWIDYEGDPFSVVRSYDVTIYARTCDLAGNISETTSLVLESDLGNYTASYEDISFGNGVMPVGFERTYNSKKGWFFTFEANIANYTNGYVFTDFYGNEHYYIANDEAKYISAYGEELKIEDGTLLDTNYSYVVTYGEFDCYFNNYGKLAIVKDKYNAVTYSWTSNNIYITDEASNTSIVSLSGGKPIHISSSRFDSKTNTTLSKNVQYQWTNGNLTKFIDSANIEHTYVYTNGLLTKNEDENIVYSADGRVKKITQANGAFIKYTYNDIATSVDEEFPSHIGAATVSDSKGITDIWYYADKFSVSNVLYKYSTEAIYNPNNISNEITTDTISQVAYTTTVPYAKTVENSYIEYPIFEIDAEDNLIFYSYDSENTVIATLLVKSGMLNVTETTTFEQAEAFAEEKTEYTYNSYGNVTSETYKKRIDSTLVNQEKTTYTYNDYGSIVTRINYQWLDNTWYPMYSEEYTYNDYGNITKKVVTSYINTKNTETDTVEVLSEASTTLYVYDVWCQLVKVITNAGKENETISETEYDILGRKTTVVSDGKTIVYTYDHRGNVLEKKENEKTIIYSYDDNGNLISKTNSNGTVASYIFDAYGNLVEHSFNGYTFTYNTLGSILTITAGNSELVNYTYSNTVNQEVLTSTFGNGQRIVYTYNSDGKITTIKLGEETKYGYEYYEITDENGEVIAEHKELFDYINNLKKIIEENKTIVKDLNDNFIYSVERVHIDKEVENSFNGVVTTIGNNVYTVVSEEDKDIFKTDDTIDFTRKYTYVNNDLTTVKTEKITTSFDYNADKLISVLENTLNNVSKVYSYTYDDNGNIITETFTTSDTAGNIVTSETISYTYDDKEQLISAETSAIKYEYTYDDIGNILEKKEYTVTVGANGEKIYNLIDASTDLYVYDEIWKDKLTSYNDQIITYDAFGNPTNYMGTALTWTMGRQLASFGNISYTYNEDGIRTSKTSNGVTTNFYLDRTNIIGQSNETTTLYFFYDSRGEIVGFKYNGNNYLYVKNLMNDVVGIVDIEGNLIASYDYDPWGKVISITGADTIIGDLNPFRYRSYYYDSDIQMYYLMSRYYDPEIGRFINPNNVKSIDTSDSELSCNVFAYCQNNPVNNFSNHIQSPEWINQIINIIQSIVNSIKTIFLSKVQYEVPLYNQGIWKLCWAFCQVMIEDYRNHIVRSAAAADIRAREIAISVYGESDWNRAGWPTNAPNPEEQNGKPIPTIKQIKNYLITKGPMYAYYCGDEHAHLVVITGVDTTRNLVYTNDPRGYSGAQSYSDFCRRTLGTTDDSMPFKFLVFAE